MCEILVSDNEGKSINNQKNTKKSVKKYAREEL
jgi:hypothetical protein